MKLKKFLPGISFKAVFFISLYSLNIHLYSFLSLVYTPLFLYTSLQMQINAYLFLSFCQSKFTAISFKPVFYLTLFFEYPSIFVPIFCLSTSISLYLFVNPDWCQSLSTPFSLSQPNPDLYPPVSVFISFLSTTISYYLLFIKIHVHGDPF